MGRINPFSAASKATGLHSGRFYTTTRLSAGECKSNLTTQVLVAPALHYSCISIYMPMKYNSTKGWSVLVLCEIEVCLQSSFQLLFRFADIYTGQQGSRGRRFSLTPAQFGISLCSGG